MRVKFFSPFSIKTYFKTEQYEVERINTYLSGKVKLNMTLIEVG